MNFAFFKPRNLMIIVAIAILFHLAAQPLYATIGGSKGE